MIVRLYSRRRSSTARFYLSTSALEGMSNALLEAMSFGVVPLVSNVSGARDIVDPGRSGFLFEAGDLNDVVAKLELMNRTAQPGRRSVRVSESSKSPASIFAFIELPWTETPFPAVGLRADSRWRPLLVVSTVPIEASE